MKSINTVNLIVNIISSIVCHNNLMQTYLTTYPVGPEI